MDLGSDCFILGAPFFLYLNSANHSTLQNLGFALNLDEYLLAIKLLPELKNRLRWFSENQYNSRASGTVQSLIRNYPSSYRCFNRRAVNRVASRQLFDALPYISKTTLRQLPPFDPSDFPETTWIKFTSGTTGRPVPILYSAPFYFDLLHLSIHKIVSFLEVPLQEVQGVAMLSLTDSSEADNFWLPDPLNRIGIVVQYAVCDPNSKSALEALSRIASSLAPTLLTIKPSLLTVLCRNGFTLPRSVRTILVSGSDISEEQRSIFSTYFSRPVYSAYGMTEFGLMAIECSKMDGYHIDCSKLLIESREIFDERELIASSIDNSAMPLLRYCTGDCGYVVSKECSCGRLSPRIKGINGRLVLPFRKSDGSFFTPSKLNKIFRHTKIMEFRVTQESTGDVLIEVELIKNASPVWEDVKKWLIDECSADFGRDIRIKPCLTVFDNAKKFQRFISYV